MLTKNLMHNLYKIITAYSCRRAVAFHCVSLTLLMPLQLNPCPVHARPQAGE